jgi:hypothetical protein
VAYRVAVSGCSESRLFEVAGVALYSIRPLEIAVHQLSGLFGLSVGSAAKTCGPGEDNSIKSTA